MLSRTLDHVHGKDNAWNESFASWTKSDGLRARSRAKDLDLVTSLEDENTLRDDDISASRGSGQPDAGVGNSSPVLNNPVVGGEGLGRSASGSSREESNLRRCNNEVGASGLDGNSRGALCEGDTRWTHGVNRVESERSSLSR